MPRPGKVQQNAVYERMSPEVKDYIGSKFGPFLAAAYEPSFSKIFDCAFKLLKEIDNRDQDWYNSHSFSLAHRLSFFKKRE